MRNFLIISIGIFLLVSCSSDDNSSPILMSEITSASVAFAYNDQVLQDFFQNPTEASINGYFYFEEDLAEDVIFGLDIEWLEGVDNPINFEGADWMALAGFNRNGILWFPIGSPQNREGIPTNTDNWEIRDIGTPLNPGTWYKMTITANFALRQFSSIRLEGGGIDFETDISEFPLEYPNYIPFDLPSLTFYQFALRSREFSPDNEGGTKVYFDDIQGFINTPEGTVTIFEDGFENQDLIEEIPVELPVIPISSIRETFWYFENEDAKIKITNEISRSGIQALECDANLNE